MLNPPGLSGEPKNVLIHYIIKSESPVIQKNYRTFAFVRVELVGFALTYVI